MTPCRQLLPLLAVLALVPTAFADEPTVKLTAEEQTLLDLTNKEREKAKLPPLRINPLLTEAARAHSKNMAKQDKFDHVLDGKKPTDRATAAGYDWAWVGENIASTTGEPTPGVFEKLMKSPDHRDNILSKKFEEVGVGTAKSDKGELFYTQVFGTPRKK